MTTFFRHNVKRVLLGAHDLYKENPNEQLFYVSKVTLHEHFKPGIIPENDLAILELDGMVQKPDLIYPICVPKLEDSFAGQHAQVAGKSSNFNFFYF